MDFGKSKLNMKNICKEQKGKKYISKQKIELLVQSRLGRLYEAL